jgi:hypothetical protein
LQCKPLLQAEVNKWHYFFLAVLAAILKSAFVGAPLLPGARIFSLEPAAIRACFALMFE